MNMYDLINNVIDDVDLIIFHTKNVILVIHFVLCF